MIEFMILATFLNSDCFITYYIVFFLTLREHIGCINWFLLSCGWEFVTHIWISEVLCELRISQFHLKQYLIIMQWFEVQSSAIDGLLGLSLWIIDSSNVAIARRTLIALTPSPILFLDRRSKSSKIEVMKWYNEYGYGVEYFAILPLPRQKHLHNYN